MAESLTSSIGRAVMPDFTHVTLLGVLPCLIADVVHLSRLQRCKHFEIGGDKKVGFCIITLKILESIISFLVVLT